MLFKLSLGNIRRSVRDYSIYFFTLLIGVAVFYVFNAIETQTAFLFVSNDTRAIIKLLTDTLSAVSVFVSCVLGGLIVYASRFLMRRRNKEFAMYLLLGMSKGKVSGILLTETLIVGAVSLGAGLLLGIGLSQLMSAFIVNLFDADMTVFAFTFSGSAALKTLFYFGLIYVVTMLFNAGAVGKFKLIDLISWDKKAEVQKLKNPVVCIIVFAAAAVMLGYAYFEVAFDFDNIDALWKMLLYIAMGAASTFMLFWSVSGMLMRIAMSSKRSYYRGLNSFTYRQIGSRINTMVISAGIICLMLFITICMLAAAFSLKNSLDEGIMKNAPADLSMELMFDKDEAPDKSIREMFDMTDVDIDKYFSEYTEFDEYMLYDFTGADYFGEYLDEARQKMKTVYFDSVAEDCIKVSDYNKVAKLYGLEQLEVPSGTYAVVASLNEAIDVRNIPLAHGHEITLYGKRLSPAYSKCLFGYDMISNTPANFGKIIVPDDTELLNYRLMKCLAANYRAETKAEKRSTDTVFMNSDKEIFSRIYGDSEDKHFGIIMTKNELIDSAVGLGAVATFLGLYIGIVFLISCGAILSIKALSENIDSIPRYDILRRIGAADRDISRSLFRQTG
ncbi:MAG: FtsX-like permease family protein, partial [Ruminiclostridium sp.]|nr:FtsX-like permease family protein [Ruminiclostridium sp.]